MSAKPRITFPLDIADVVVLKTEINARGDYIITVESAQMSTACRKCGREISKVYGPDKWVQLRHLPILGRRVYLRLRPKRYECPYCDDHPTTTQKQDWYETKSPHTRAYDHHLLLQLVNSTLADVSHKEAVGYAAVEGAVRRHIATTVDWGVLTKLGVIGIGEIALRKGRNSYVALITTQQTDGRVVILAVLPDRKKETVRAFLETIPKRLWPTMHTVCTDMWEGYVNAAKEFATAHGEVTLRVVVDRFHVAKNYRDLTASERVKLRRLFAYAPDLKLAYTLREELTAIFNRRLSKEQARLRLSAWQAKVRGSDLTCFDKFLKTLDHWLDEITNYFVDRLSSGFVEGLNNKLDFRLKAA
ncbi:MAG: transposase [Anaerolineae bacterium]|nr:transposase [Anaerolineae bacterium]